MFEEKLSGGISQKSFTDIMANLDEESSKLKSGQKSEYKDFLFQAMYLALNDLKKLNLYWHKLICEFYFGEEKITLEQLGKMHNVTRQAVTKSFRRALNVLRQIAEEYLENIMK